MTSSIPKPPQRIRVEMPAQIAPKPVPETLLEATSPEGEILKPAGQATSSKVHVSHPKKLEEEQPKPIAAEVETPATTPEDTVVPPQEADTITAVDEAIVASETTVAANEMDTLIAEPTETETPIATITTGAFSVPLDEELYKRQYYTIGEVADMFGANQSQIRFWENEFEILQPKKNKKGDRYFRPEDVKNLVLIRHLLQERRFTIEGAKEYLKGKTKRLSDRHEAIQQLEKLKGFLQEMKTNLAGTAV